MKLSVVDQSPVPTGSTPADALRNTIDLARAVERLGYQRYWIAEHHATAAYASPAPEVMIARVAAETSHIRVGSGAVLLPHYSPLKVAETFRVLQALYPGRIDLGVGRAPGAGPLGSFALRRERSATPPPDDFGRQLPELLAWLNRGFPPEHPFSKILVSPETEGGPEVWLLGSSMWSASAAAQLGLPYAFAHFINPEPTRQAIEYYRSHVTVSGEGAQVILAVPVICAETESEAQRLFSSLRIHIRHIRQGIDRGPIPTPEQALAELGADAERGPSSASTEWPRIFVGAADRVRDQLTDMTSQLGVDEIMVVTVVHDHRARIRSHQLLAEAFGIRPRAQAS